jgi:hypothetical protein
MSKERRKEPLSGSYWNILLGFVRDLDADVMISTSMSTAPSARQYDRVNLKAGR